MKFRITTPSYYRFAKPSGMKWIEEERAQIWPKKQEFKFKWKFNGQAHVVRNSGLIR